MELAKLMSRSNCDAISLLMIVELSTKEKNSQGHPGPPIGEHFQSSPWYSNFIFMLQHLQAPHGVDRTRAIFLKQKASRFCILNGKFYWKESEGVLLNCVNGQEAKKIIE